MTITALTDLSLLPNKTMDQQAFDNAMAYMIRNLALRAQQENDLAANLNSIAAGGGFAIPYIFNPGDLAKTDTLISVNDPYSQSTTTNLFVNRVSTNGINYSPILNEFAGSTSTVKGYARIVKQGDPSKFLVFAVLAVGTYDRYFQLSGVVIQGSQSNPFGINDSVLLTFTRTGDMGKTGDTGTYPSALIRDQRATGTAPQGLPAGQWVTRTLNTTIANNISGLAVANNIFFLPAGTYWIEVWATAAATYANQLRLFNITDNTQTDIGLNARNSTSDGTSTYTTLRTVITISSGKNFRIDHYSNNGGNAGVAINTPGAAEIYLDMRITKTL